VSTRGPGCKYQAEYERETHGPIQYERRDFYALITLDRPEKHNALDKAAWNGNSSALQRASEEDMVRTRIVQGAGDAYCAGDDIAEMSKWKSAHEGREYFDDVSLPAIEEMRTHQNPMVSLVDGVVTWMRCELV
jgi:enoyl-CoA hydratase/carnithine racemase